MRLAIAENRSVDAIVEHNLQAFIECRHAPASYEGGVISWQEEAYCFVIEPQASHIVMSIALDCLGADKEELLLALYRYILPSRFMGLPVRVYGSGALIVATLAIPLQVVTLDNLMELHSRLCRLLDPTDNF